eukprot:gene390-biopygen1079
MLRTLLRPKNRLKDMFLQPPTLVGIGWIVRCHSSQFDFVVGRSQIKHEAALGLRVIVRTEESIRRREQERMKIEDLELRQIVKTEDVGLRETVKTKEDRKVKEIVKTEHVGLSETVKTEALVKTGDNNCQAQEDAKCRNEAARIGETSQPSYSVEHKGVSDRRHRQTIGTERTMDCTMECSFIVKPRERILSQKDNILGKMFTTVGAVLSPTYSEAPRGTSTTTTASSPPSPTAPTCGNDDPTEEHHSGKCAIDFAPSGCAILRGTGDESVQDEQNNNDLNQK